MDLGRIIRDHLGLPPNSRKVTTAFLTNCSLIFSFQDTNYSRLRSTSSSYSLHVSFKPQKLFPTKPSTTSSNWSSILRRYTKTSPYGGNPNGSPGPYYPSSPHDSTIPAQSPLTLNKVTPYSFDCESVVSFYNYEPEAVGRIDSWSDLERGLGACNSEGALYSYQADKFKKSNVDGIEMSENPRIQVNNSRASAENANSHTYKVEKENFDFSQNITMAQCIESCDGVEEDGGSGKRVETTNCQGHRERTVDSDKAETSRPRYYSLEVPEIRNVSYPHSKRKSKPTTPCAQGKSLNESHRVSSLDGIHKNSLEHDNSDTRASLEGINTTPSSLHEKSIAGEPSSLCYPDASVVPKTTIRGTNYKNEAEVLELDPQNSNFDQDWNEENMRNSTSHLNHEVDMESETLNMNNNFDNDGDSNSVFENHPYIPEKTGEGVDEGNSTTKTSKKTLKPASFLTPVAREDSTRNSFSIEKSLMLVHCSSVCVVIPRATDLRGYRSPVNVLRRKCAALVMKPAFEWFIISVIFLNTIVMAMESHDMNKKLENTMDKINLVSTCR